MAKWCGKIGYAVTEETSPGVFIDRIEEHFAAGEMLRNTRRYEAQSESSNDEVKLNNQLSVVMDAYTMSQYSAMRYVEFMGALWKVTNVEIQTPRILITIGGAYHGETANGTA